MITSNNNYFESINDFDNFNKQSILSMIKAYRQKTKCKHYIFQVKVKCIYNLSYKKSMIEILNNFGAKIMFEEDISELGDKINNATWLKIKTPILGVEKILDIIFMFEILYFIWSDDDSPNIFSLENFRKNTIYETPSDICMYIANTKYKKCILFLRSGDEKLGDRIIEKLL